MVTISTQNLNKNNQNTLTADTLQFNHKSAKKKATTSLRQVASDDNIQEVLSTLSFENSLQATSFLIKFNDLLNLKLH